MSAAQPSLLALAALATLALSLSLSAQEAPRTPPAELRAADFPSIQAALDALPDSGGIVYLPPGLVEIQTPLILTKPETRIEGAGAATHLKNLNEDGQPALLIRPETIETDPKARLWRIQVGNLRISGNEKSGDGIRAEGINEIFLHGLSLDHHGRHGIALIQCIENPRVVDSMLTYNQEAGLFIDRGHDIVVNANHFEENNDALVCIDSYNLCMNGNNIDDHLGNGVVIENTYGSVLSGNMIEECDGSAIILDRDSYGITISANVIAHDLGGGIDLRDAHGITISANTFVLVHDFGVRASAACSRITITGNQFCNSYIGEGKERLVRDHENPARMDVAQGIALENTKHILISGNQFSGLDGPAVRSHGVCQQILISGNLLTDLNRRSPDSTEPFAFSPETKVTLSDNLID